MQAHIRRNHEAAFRAEREAEREADHTADLAIRVERDREGAYLARAAASYARGESEEAFEAREAAAIAAEYRVTDRVNREICEIFAAAGIASERFFQNDRRAA